MHMYMEDVDKMEFYLSDWRGKVSKWLEKKKPQPTCSVPMWEKRFCWEVGSVPWHKLVVLKKDINRYNNVLEWKDSASEEAFNNAKLRYWSKINGQPCRIPLPSPDMFIDEVDWSHSNVDSEAWFDDLEEERDKDNLGLSGDQIKPKTVRWEDMEWENIIKNIKPTGWDISAWEEHMQEKNVLTGMVVGDD